MVSLEEWKVGSVRPTARVDTGLSLSGALSKIHLRRHAEGDVTNRLSLNDVILEWSGASAMVVPFDSTSSSVSSKQVRSGTVSGLSKSAAVTSGIVSFVRMTRFASVIPDAARTIGLALLTCLPKLRRLNRNLTWIHIEQFVIRFYRVWRFRM